MTAKNENTTATESHFFATFALGWATAATREEAIEKLVNSFRSDAKRIAANILKDNGRGLYIWSVEVGLPESANYKIEFYCPKDVPLSNPCESYVTRVTQKEINFWTEEQKPKAKAA